MPLLDSHKKPNTRKDSVVLWTRPAECWQKDQALFAGKSLSVLRLPCIFRQALAPDPRAIPRIRNTDLSWFILFTSPHAVKLFCEHQELTAVLTKARKIYAFGEKTVAALSPYSQPNLNIETAPPECRSLQAWAPRLRSRLLEDCSQTKNPNLLLPGAKQRAFDFAPFLKESGLKTLRLDLYETVSGIRDPEGSLISEVEFDQKLSSLRNKNSVLCFASPSAVRGFSASYQGFLSRRHQPIPHLSIACLGPTTLRAARSHFASCSLAATNHLQALVHCAESLYFSQHNSLREDS